MQTIGDRIKWALSKRGKKAPWLGGKVGVSRSAIYQWINGETKGMKPENLILAARALQVRPEWLATGDQPIEPHVEYVPSDFKSVDLMQARPIPVINYAQAGHLREFSDDYAPGAGIEEVFVDAELAEALSKHAFGLAIRGDSMEPEFSEGDIVIIDPSVAPLPGDYVVARELSSQATTFKRYRARGNDTDGSERFELVPLNDDYATIMCDADNPCELIGTMIEHRRRRRR